LLHWHALAEDKRRRQSLILHLLHKNCWKWHLDEWGNGGEIGI